MYDQNQNEMPSDGAPRRSRGIGSKIAMVAGGAALLVAGAMYAPVLMQNTPVTAGPATLAPAQAPIAQLMDSSLAEDQAALAALYEVVSPSVVNIQVVGDAQEISMPDIPGFELPEGMPNMPQRGEGSGFIYDNEGHIVTNNHVVEDATEVLVNFSNGMWAPAEVVATDPQADLAVIKVTPPEGLDWRPLPLAEDGSLKVGHLVIAMGNPFGLENTMTTGIVSALGRSFPVGAFGTSRYSLPDVIQTDAAINPGNSGGPLLDLNGNVVGVNFAIESRAGSNSGVGFAIPASIVKRVAPELIKDGKFEYAYLGLQGSTITAELANALDLPQNELGVYVSSVVPGGPAEAAGVQGGSETVTNDDGFEFQKGGDIVTAIDDVPVRRFEDLVSFLVTRAAPGQSVTLTVERDGTEQQLTVELGERPTQPVVVEREGEPGQINARAAMAIAEDAAEEEGLTGDVVEKSATPEERDGTSVWVVELRTDSQSATVVVDADNGDVLDVTVE
jgi:serine protease Do